MSLQVVQKYFTVIEYQNLVDTGILKENDRCELLNGEIVYMSPVGRKHASKVNRLTELFIQLFSKAITVSIQNPIEIGPYSQPEPDIAILRRQEDFYASGHPKAEDVYLIIEVADSTLETDRNIKLPLYAQAKIQEVWIVNIQDNQIEVYHQPIGNQYTQTKIITSGQILTLNAFPEITIKTSDILD